MAGIGRSPPLLFVERVKVRFSATFLDQNGAAPLSRSFAPAAPGAAAFPTWCLDLAAACLAIVAVLAYHAGMGFPALRDVNGDNDSLMRLVQIRAPLDGQGWFDLQQYRMGLEGGFPLHWSRLVDLPIAALIVSAAGLGFGLAAAEAFALTAWPMLLFVAGLFLVIDTARKAGSDTAVLPALVLGAVAFHFTGEFRPGAIDHHNIQLVLVLGMVNRLAVGGGGARAGLVAGACAALSIAIGMETAPYVPVAGLSVALLFLFRGAGAARLARGFGLAFFACTALAFGALIHPAGWATPRCDALSSFQLAVATLGGVGLAVLVTLPGVGGDFRRRLIALAGLGAVTFVMVVGFFPQCLASPYAGLDPRMRELWLDHVAEAQSLPTLLAAAPHKVTAYFVTPLIGLAVLAVRLARRDAGRGLPVLFAMLAMAFLVSAWQVRGSTFSITLAVIPLAIWVGTVRERAMASSAAWPRIAMVGAWLVSTNVVWTVAGAVLAGPAGEASRDGEEASACYAGTDYLDLARLPPATVLASSNLGASILAHTHHRALAGPYHRNQAGNLAVLDALMAPPGTARETALALGIDYVAICPGNPETPFLAARAPEGLIALLARGEAPDWLIPVHDDADLRVYEFVPAPGR
jgi:hypothetical protein